MISVVNTTGIVKGRRGSGVVKFIMKSQTGIQYPDGTQEHCTGCEQEVERGVEVSLQLIKCKRGEHL